MNSVFYSKNMTKFNLGLVFIQGLALLHCALSLPSYPGNVLKVGDEELTPLVPEESCYYEVYNRRLACVCKTMDMAAYIDLKLSYFVYNSGKEIREVQLRQCRHLTVNLNLTQVDSSQYPIHFQAIGELVINGIQFEPQFRDRQDLELYFYNIQVMKMEDLDIVNTLKLKANNVKEARFKNITFAHIPVNGFEISDARLLDIRDSVFLRVSPRSVVIEKTKEVYVSDNQMSINALEAVHAKDGSLLFISCNRILNRPISPECSRTTSTTSTTTTTTTPIPIPPIQDYERSLGSKERMEENGEEKNDGGAISGELIGGVVAGVVVIVAAILLFILFRRRRSRSQKVDEKGPTELDENIENGQTKGADPVEEPEEKQSLLKDEEQVKEALDDDEEEDPEDVEMRPKFTSPIWIEEIQRNKIFNRQKSLLSEENFKHLSTNSHQLEGVQEQPEIQITPPSAEPADEEDNNGSQSELQTPPAEPSTPPPEPTTPPPELPAVTIEILSSEPVAESAEVSSENQESEANEKKSPKVVETDM